MEQNTNGETPTRGTRTPRWVWLLFVVGLLFLLFGRWFDALFYAAFGLFMLVETSVLRLAKWVQQLILVVFAVLAIARFVMLIWEFSARP